MLITCRLKAELTTSNGAMMSDITEPSEEPSATASQ